jgi:hypothetical protein
MPEDRVVPEHELLLHLQGLDGPVTTAQILEHVQRSNAPTAVTATIERLPDREWPGQPNRTATPTLLGSSATMRVGPGAHHVAPIPSDPSEELFMTVARFVSRSSTCAGRALVHTAPRWAVL